MAAPAPRRFRLFGLELLDAEPAACARHLVDRALTSDRPWSVQFVNAHCANVMARDAAYRAALHAADALLPDGAGIELAAWCADGVRPHNLNGTDLFPWLLAESAARSLTVGFVGARPGIAARCAERMRERFAGLQVVLAEHGYQDAAALRGRIAECRPALLFVAMGVPRQEMFIAAGFGGAGVRLAFGVGALFDFHSGAMPRAPRWLRRLRLEWLYRLWREPRRMAGRYLLGNAVFLARVAALRLRGTEALRARSTAW